MADDNSGKAGKLMRTSSDLPHGAASASDQRTITSEQQQVSGQAVAKPKSARRRDPKPNAPPVKVADMDPLSGANLRLNGHRSPLDPVLGLSFPTIAAPNPVTVAYAKEPTLAAAVFQRDNYICRYCGFRSLKHQVALARFGAVTNSQGHCACPFCAQVTALDKVADMRSGVLVHLPDIGQAEINLLAKIIYVCRISRGAAADLAKAKLNDLVRCRDAAKEAIGTDEPMVLAQRMIAAKTPEEYAELMHTTKNIRLFPLDRRVIQEGDLEFNQFPQILAYWRFKDGPFGGLNPNNMDLAAFIQSLDSVAETPASKAG